MGKMDVFVYVHVLYVLVFLANNNYAMVGSEIFSKNHHRLVIANETFFNESKQRNLLNDREVIDNVLGNYRFPELSANISVTVSISIDRITNENEHECSLWFTMEQKWVETKLMFENKRSNGAKIRLQSGSHIWNPSISVFNALNMRNIGKEEMYLHSNGMVELMQRFSVKTMEIHDLHSFPFDKRNCSLVFYSEDSRVNMVEISSVTVQRAGWGVWTVLGYEQVGKTITLSLKRSVTMWIWMLYGPTTALFIISWLLLWTKDNFANQQFVISITAFFTVLIIVICNGRNITRTSYPKAIDIWNLQITVFAFLVILQSAFIIKKNIRKRKSSRLINSFGDECVEKTQWFIDAPYYAHLPERRPKTVVRILSCTFQIMILIVFFVVCTLYAIYYVHPYLI